MKEDEESARRLAVRIVGDHLAPVLFLGAAIYLLGWTFHSGCGIACLVLAYCLFPKALYR